MSDIWTFFLILDSDKEKLKKYWKLINQKIEQLNLKINKKSNIYRASKGFEFLGYKYILENNKLCIRYSKKSFFRIKNNLKKYKLHDPVFYHRSLASYYGYFKIIKVIEKRDFSLTCNGLYKLYKEKYTNSLVVIKDSSSYKSYLDDAKVLWYLFHFNYKNESVCFSSVSYDKVSK